MKVKFFTVMLFLAGFSVIPTHAQIGNLLKKGQEALNKKTQEVKDKSNQNDILTSSDGTKGVDNSVLSSTQHPEDVRIALAKLRDESKRTAPKIWILEEGTEIGGGHFDPKRPNEPFQKNMANFILRVHTITKDSLANFKKLLEARHAENLSILNALSENNGGRLRLKEEVKHEILNMPTGSMAFDKVEREVQRYNTLMDRAIRDLVVFSDIRIEGGQASVHHLSVGSNYLGVRQGKVVFLVKDERTGIERITPIPGYIYDSQMEEKKALLAFIRKEPPAEQYPEYAKGQLALQYIYQAQSNTLAMQEKVAVPTPKMNNSQLKSKMLQLARTKYPTWNIAELIIADSAWTVEKNDLGEIIHRKINTHIIFPSPGGYLMRTLSFIEPYSGGGKYGEVRPYGIGTDQVAVSYKK